MEEQKESRQATSEPFLQLLEEHVRLDQLLLQSQTRLIGSQPAGSLQILRQFQTEMEGHIRGEEEVILPFYGSHAVIPKGADVSYFLNEHRRLRRLMAESVAWMEAWQGLSWPPEEVVGLIERQKTFKEVMEHHDEREHISSIH